MKLAIWWTSQEEEREVIGMGAHKSLPKYIKEQLASRQGRAGRLWAVEEMGTVSVKWNKKKPVTRLCKNRAGIVLYEKDIAAVFYLAGFCTDLDMNIINQLEGN